MGYTDFLIKKQSYKLFYYNCYGNSMVAMEEIGCHRKMLVAMEKVYTCKSFLPVIPSSFMLYKYVISICSDAVTEWPWVIHVHSNWLLMNMSVAKEIL